jgi:hypothetical protein
MTIDSVLDVLYQTTLAAEIRENELAFPWIETVHVLAITLVVGSIAAVDLRLLGLASRDRTAARVMADLLPITWIAFAFAAASGALMFISNATAYSHNVYFRAKLVLLLLAGCNMAIFQVFVERRVRATDAGARLPGAARVAALCSLSLWLLVVAAGRWIGFTMLAGY